MAPHAEASVAFRWHVLLVVALCLLCTLLYVPGLNSLFLFDDAPNLGALEYLHGLGPGDEGFREFVASGTSGPLGRPVSLFSFALQADAWPENPFAFKAVNLTLHLLNGILVYLIANMLAGVCGLGGKTRLQVAALSTALWLLHPAQSATVLYAVQRMTLLSTFFMLAALAGYLTLRLRYKTEWKSPLFLAGLAGCVLLGVVGLFAKENAASLLFYVLVLEFTLLASVQTNALLRLGRFLLAGIGVLFFIFVAFRFNSLTAGFDGLFDYGPWERLMTQARILWYLFFHAFFPGPESTGLFIQFEPSTSLVTPWTTAIAAGTWLLLAVAALLARKRFPLAAFALFWFFAGHLLESTILPLEMFFQHRNYLALFGPVFAFVLAVEALVRKLAGRLDPRVFRVLPFALTLLFALQLGLLARLWHDPLELAFRWVNANPDDPRNQQFFANQLAAHGQLDGALQVYAGQMENTQIDGLWASLNYLILSCHASAPLPISVERVLAAVEPDRFPGRALLTPLRQLNDLVTAGDCATVSAVQMENLLRTVGPRLGAQDQGYVQYELARLSLVRGEQAEALRMMDAAWSATGDAGILFLQADLLIQRGENRQALQKVEQALASLEEHNDLKTGTRAMKRDILGSMRDYLLEQEGR